MEAEVQAFVVAYMALQSTNYTHAAATALLIWDWCLTLEPEVRYFWSGKRSWPRLLFFLNRYLPLLAQALNLGAAINPIGTDEFCRFWLIGFLPWTGAIAIFIAQIILVFRLYGLYGNSRKILVPILVFFTLCATAGFAILGWTVAHLSVTAHPFPGLTICANTNDAPILYAVWIPVLVFEAVAFALAMFKVCLHLRSEFQAGGFGASLMEVILRDNIIYISVVTAIYVSNGMLWRFGPPMMREVIDGPSVAIVSILGTRMLINLRERHDESTHPSFGTITAPMEVIAMSDRSCDEDELSLPRGISTPGHISLTPSVDDMFVRFHELREG